MEKFHEINKKIIEEVLYYIEHEDATYSDVAKAFGYSSEESIKKHFKSFKMSDDPSYSYLKSRLELKSKKSVSSGRIKGGKALNSGKDLTISDDDLVKIFGKMVHDDLTYSDLEFVTGISKSTLHNNMNRLKTINRPLFNEVEILLYRHKKGIGLTESFDIKRHN